MPRPPILAVLAGLALPALAAGQVLIGSEPFLVEGGAGTQTEPHVSGSLVSFTHQSSTTSEIRYEDLATASPSAGIDNSIPAGGTYRDSISDVSGGVIVFKRASDLGPTESIMFFDSANPSAGSQVLADAPGTQRQGAAIGGTTVAFEQKTASTLARDICVASISDPTAPATCLTDSLMNRDPAVSPDGNTVVWARCTGLLSGCDIWAASKNAVGGWDAPRAITSGGGNDIFPDTNGVVVTYASNLDGDPDIYFSNLDGTGLTNRIAVADSGGSSEENPNISGGRIAFQRRTAVGQPADLFIYDLVGNALYPLTQTPADEKLNDISTTAGGQSWVVWAAVDPVTNTDDVWAATFTLSTPDPCEEDPAAVCANPGSRELLTDATVTRAPGSPNSVSRTFAAEEDESGVMCITNDRAAGWVLLDGRLEVGPGSFGDRVTSIARAVTLEQSNLLQAVIGGKPDTSYRVQVYGSAATCTGLRRMATSPPLPAGTN